MAENTSNLRDWEDCLHDIEANAARDGIVDGIQDAVASGVHSDGIRTGLLKGLSLGLQIGYANIIATRTKATSNQLSSRQLKRCDSIIEKISHISNENDVSTDYDRAVKEINAISKLICTSDDITPFQWPSNQTYSSVVKTDW